MNYKTIVMELIERLPDLKTHLQQNHLMLANIEVWAMRLRNRHLSLIDEALSLDDLATVNDVSSVAMDVAINMIREELQQVEIPKP